MDGYSVHGDGQECGSVPVTVDTAITQPYQGMLPVYDTAQVV